MAGTGSGATFVVSLARDEERRPLRPFAGPAIDDDILVHRQFPQPFGHLAKRHEDGAGYVALGVFVRLADIDQQIFVFAVPRHVVAQLCHGDILKSFDHVSPYAKRKVIDWNVIGNLRQFCKHAAI